MIATHEINDRPFYFLCQLFRSGFANSAGSADKNGDIVRAVGVDQGVGLVDLVEGDHFGVLIDTII